MLSLGQGYFVIFHIGTERGRYFVIFQTYFRAVCSSDPQGTSIGDSLVAFPGLLTSEKKKIAAVKHVTMIKIKGKP